MVLKAVCTLYMKYFILFLIKHLVGHFGGAWQNQKIDFAAFPGVVIVTTNCVIEPLKLYRDRLYTVNETGLHGVKHIDLHNMDHSKQMIEVCLF